MIEGVVNAAGEAVIPITVRGPTGRSLNIEAIVDTGFGGFLTLPPFMVAELDLRFEGVGRATLADGSETTFPYYDVAVLWHDRQRFGLVDAADTTPLVGMSLLYGHSLYIDVKNGGRVVIESTT